MQHKTILAFIGFLIVGGLFTLSLGQDVNYDLKNYHFYNAYAYLNNRYTHDLAAAQLQTYLNPILDVAYYKQVVIFNDPLIITFLMGLWYGLLAWTIYKLISILQPSQHIIISIVGTVLGVSGVAAIGQAGTTTHEVITTALVMLSLLLCIIGIQSNNLSSNRFYRFSGLIAGISVGCKLTAASFIIALFVAIITLIILNKKQFKPSSVLHFFPMLLIGFILTGGYWHYFLWRHYESPLFPFYNNFFGSAYYEKINLYVSAWRAITVEKMMLYPFELSQINRPLKEEMFSDPRLMLGFVTSIALLMISIAKIRKRKIYNSSSFNMDNPITTLMIAIVWILSYGLWAYLHGIYRYAIFLEALSAIVIVGLLYQCNLRTRIIAFLLIGITVTSIYQTHYLSWGRIGYGQNAYEVSPPPIKPNALVVMLSSRPMSYVIPFFPKETRFVSPQNNFTSIEHHNLLQQHIHQTINQWTGPMYAISPAGYNFMNDVVLNKFSLHVDYIGEHACKPILSNIDRNALQICGLTRK